MTRTLAIALAALVATALLAPAADARQRPISYYNGTWVVVVPPFFYTPAGQTPGASPFGVWQAKVSNGRVTNADVFTQPFTGPPFSPPQVQPGSAVGSTTAMVDVPLANGRTNRKKQATLNPRSSSFLGPVCASWNGLDYYSGGFHVPCPPASGVTYPVGGTLSTRATTGSGIPRAGRYTVTATPLAAVDGGPTTGASGTVTLRVTSTGRNAARVTGSGSLVPVNAAGAPAGGPAPVSYGTATIAPVTGLFQLPSTPSGYAICGVFDPRHNYAWGIVGCDETTYVPSGFADALS
jgi:hypothetical protein